MSQGGPWLFQDERKGGGGETKGSISTPMSQWPDGSSIPQEVRKRVNLCTVRGRVGGASLTGGVLKGLKRGRDR